VPASIQLAHEAAFRLGTVWVHPATRQVKYGEQSETVEPRVMLVLVALHQAGGDVVSRDELIARCWAGRVVGEDALNRAISRVRDLGRCLDDAYQLETIPKVGYRLVVGPVITPEDRGTVDRSAVRVANDDIATSNFPSRRWVWGVGLFSLLLTALAVAVWLLLLARPTAPSVAVLRFVNLSGDAKEDYFSDGMTEEITSALAKIPNLLIVGRSSAFAFEGKNEDSRTIGRELHAAYLMEGSVRKAGDRVRITARLLNAATGDEVWAESYDRSLSDIFAAQEDVAKSIAGALRVPLGLDRSDILIANRNIDSGSYDDYLRAAALLRKRDLGARVDLPVSLLEGIVARQPNYAPAWALLADAYSYAPYYDPAFQRDSGNQLSGVFAETLSKAEVAARQAIKLDPRSTDAYVALGRVQGYQAKWLASEQSLQKAINLGPSNPNVLHTYSLFLAATGQIKMAVAVREKLYTLDPLAPIYNNATVGVLLSAGENYRALSFAQSLPRGSGARAVALMRVYLATRQYNKALASILDAPAGLFPPANLDTAVRLLRAAPASAPKQEYPYMGSLSVVFLYVGIPERALDPTERNANAGFSVLSNIINVWQPDFVAARNTKRFKALVHNLHLPEYWRAKDWPDLCHPVGADDFACN
jgi:TolB-like protein/DNA-binding winged helix-turn-helix (wHTH) protein